VQNESVLRCNGEVSRRRRRRRRRKGEDE